LLVDCGRAIRDGISLESYLHLHMPANNSLSQRGAQRGLAASNSNGM